jgi:cysteinyl-tRNA synthetase
VNYWLHVAHLLVEGKKMAKSLGNFFTVRDLLGKGFNGREIRFLLLSAHYREPFNFTLDGLYGARASLARLDECIGKLRDVAGTSQAEAETGLVNTVTEALDNDLNVSAAWGGVFEWVRETNRLLAEGRLAAAEAAARVAAWRRVDAVFGLGQPTEEEAPSEIQSLLTQRQAARQEKDFQRADALRDELKAKGWLIEDTSKGPRLKRVG